MSIINWLEDIKKRTNNKQLINSRSNCVNISFFDTFYAIFRHQSLVRLGMKWLIDLLFKKKEINSDKKLIVQKILLKKYLIKN